MKYKTIFFDLDDTLIDTEKNNKEALYEIFLEEKINNYFANFDDFYTKYHSININLWDLYSQHKITKNTLQTERFMKTLEGIVDLTSQQSLEMNNSFMNKTQSKKNIIEGAEDILKYLQPKYKLYILSNGFIEVQDKKIKKANLESFFAGIILSDHIGVNKPNSRIFSHALTVADASKDDSIMIGDNINTDIIGAKNSNIDQIWYNPKNRGNEAYINPTYTIKKLEELRNIL